MPFILLRIIFPILDFGQDLDQEQIQERSADRGQGLDLISELEPCLDRALRVFVR